MKKIILSAFLVSGLIFLSACSLGAKKNNDINNVNTETPIVNQQAEVNVPVENNIPVDEPSVTVLADASYVIDTNSSSLSWAASKILSGHTGKINIKSGGIVVKEGMVTIPSNFVIDMQSISDDDGSEALVKHLNSADFFDTANFPESTLNIISATSIGGSQYNIEANLTIKGITNKISFPAEINVNGGVLTAKADFSINRTLWNIKFLSASFLSDLGDKAIKDMIDFHVEITANAAGI